MPSYIPVFRRSGEYAAFITDNNIFDLQARYLGWIKEDHSVWNHKGEFVGEVVDENYILRNKSGLIPEASHRLPTPHSPIPPAHFVNLAGKREKPGWEDALELLFAA